MKIVQRNIGRAGNFKQMQEKKKGLDRIYGEGNWMTGYEVNGRFLTREQAIEEVYNPSYFKILDENRQLVEQLVNAKGVFNPHALLSKSTDIQAQTVECYMKLRGLEFKGNRYEIPIGTYQPKVITDEHKRILYSKGLNVFRNGKIVYPQISYDLSPYKVPCIINPNISVEEFWQSDAKCIAIK